MRLTVRNSIDLLLLKASNFNEARLKATLASGVAVAKFPSGLRIRDTIWDCVQGLRRLVRPSLGYAAMRLVYRSRRRMRRMEAAQRQSALLRKTSWQTPTPRVRAASGLGLLALEPRMVFDAAAVATADQVADQIAEQQAQAFVDGATPSDDMPTSALPEVIANLASASAQMNVREIAFLDGSVEDIATILATIPSSVEIVMIDPTRDGVEQIAETLRHRTEIDAIHIIAHGSEGRLNLGSTVLDAASMQHEHLDELTAIGKSLSTDGDILIYGCDFAAGERGLEAAMILGGITSADVAASNDLTGAERLGADWDLETRTGLVEAHNINAPEWNGILAPLTISVSNAPSTNGITGTGAVALWANAGTIGGTSIDIRATVTTATAGTIVQFDTAFGVNAYGIGVDADDMWVKVTDGTATIKWEIFASGTGQTIYASGDPNFRISDLDGNPSISTAFPTNEVETIAPNVTSLASYTVSNPTNLLTGVSGGNLTVIGTVTQGSESTSLVGFNWNNVSSWEVTYSAQLGWGARFFFHDGDGDFAFVAPVTTVMLGIDLDGNNSTAPATAYQAIYTENGASIPVVDIDVTIAQHAALGTDLGQAQIVLTNAQAGDVLTVGTLPSGITANIDTSVSGKITVTLSGAATVADYQTALAAVRFANTSDAPSTIDRSITVDVKNTTFSTTSAATLPTIHITAVNDAPTSTDDAVTTAENTPKVLGLDDFGTFSDIEGTAFASVKITALETDGSLQYFDGASWVAVTLNQIVTATDISSGKLRFVPDHNESGSAYATIGFQVSDGTDFSIAANSLTIDVTPVNDPPEGTDNAITIDEDSTHSFTAADFGFSDPNDTPANAFDKLIFTTLPAAGMLTLAGAPVTAGQVIAVADIPQLLFTPDANANGTPYSSFTFQVQDDGGAGSITQTVSSQNFESGLPVYDSAVYFAAGQNANGELTTNQGGVTIDGSGTAGGHFLGYYTFPGGAAPGMEIFGSAAPVAVMQNTDYEFSFRLATYAGSLLNPVVIDASINGNTVILGATVATSGNSSWTTFTGTWNSGTATTAEFSLINNTVDNGHAGVDFGLDNIQLVRVLATGVDLDPSPNTITFNVTPVNDAPVDGNETNTVTEDTTLSVGAASGLLANATDIDGGALSISGFSIAGEAGPFTVGAAYTIAGVGQLLIAADGAYAFVPATNYTGAVPVITYTVSDGNGGTDTSTLTLAMVPVNDAPVDGDETNTVTEDVALGVNAASGLLANATDIDGGALSISSFSVAGDAGPFVVGAAHTIAGVGQILIAADGAYAFVPAANYTGAIPVITYTVSDGAGGTDTSTLTLAMVPANDAPVDGDETNAVTEDVALGVNDLSGLLANATDIDGGTLSISGFSIAGEAGPFTVGTAYTIAGVGRIVITADGAYGFIPVANYTGAIPVITYTVSDGNGGTDTSTLTLAMVPVNDAPVDGSETNTVTEDVALGVNAASGLLANATDIDGGALSISSFSVAGDAGPFVVGAAHTIAGVGQILIAADGAYAFVPAANYTGAIPVITYTVSDGNGGTDTALLVITINGANDAPVIVDPANPGTSDNPIPATDPLNVIPDVATADGTALTPIDVASFVVDPDGEPLTFTLDPATTPAWLAIDPVTGLLTGTPPADASQNSNTGISGEYLVTITATDPEGETVTTTVTLAIVNLDPVAIDDAATSGEDTVSVTGNVLADPLTGDADTAPDSDPLTITSAVQGTTPIAIGTPFTVAGGGTLTINPDGSYTFEPGTAYNGLDIGETATETVTYTVADGNGGTDTALLVITINGANDAPVADDITLLIKQDEVATGKIVASDPDGNQLTYSGPQIGPSNGLVSINADGTFTYVPRFGFSGTDSFVVLVSDGNGGTTTATVNLAITPVAMIGPETNPRHPDAVQDNGLPQTLVVDGILLDTVSNVAPLGNQTVDLQVDGILLEVVNGVSRLERVASLNEVTRSWHGPIARTVDLIKLADNASIAFPMSRGSWNAQALTGFSIRMDIAETNSDFGSSERQQIVVNTLVHDRRIFVEISNTLGSAAADRVTGYSVLQANGKPLPRWVSRADSGLLLIEVPVDGQPLELKIVAHRTDGTTIDKSIAIQLPTGEVQQTESHTRRSPLFNEQLRLQRRH